MRQTQGYLNGWAGVAGCLRARRRGAGFGAGADFATAGPGAAGSAGASVSEAALAGAGVAVGCGETLAAARRAGGVRVGRTGLATGGGVCGVCKSAGLKTRIISTQVQIRRNWASYELCQNLKAVEPKANGKASGDKAGSFHLGSWKHRTLDGSISRMLRCGKFLLRAQHARGNCAPPQAPGFHWKAPRQRCTPQA